MKSKSYFKYKGNENNLTHHLNSSTGGEKFSFLIWGSLLILLFRSSFLYSHEFFNGFVSYKLYHIELASLCIIVFLSAYGGTLISILVFSLFAYPFDISSFILQLIVTAAILGGYSPLFFKLFPAGAYFFRQGYMMVVLSMLMVYYFYPFRREHYQALKLWRGAEKLYNYRAYRASSEENEKAVPVLLNNGLFLQMYGKSLSMDEQYEISIEVLREAEKYYSSYILYNTLGNNFKALGNYTEAETAYLKSLYMMPSMLLPGYLLSLLYHESGQVGKAGITARDVLSKPVKVESAATREIRDEMRKIVEVYSR